MQCTPMKHNLLMNKYILDVEKYLLILKRKIIFQAKYSIIKNFIHLLLRKNIVQILQK